MIEVQVKDIKKGDVWFNDYDEPRWTALTDAEEFGAGTVARGVRIYVKSHYGSSHWLTWTENPDCVLKVIRPETNQEENMMSRTIRIPRLKAEVQIFNDESRSILFNDHSRTRLDLDHEALAKLREALEAPYELPVPQEQVRALTEAADLVDSDLGAFDSFTQCEGVATSLIKKLNDQGWTLTREDS